MKRGRKVVEDTYFVNREVNYRKNKETGTRTEHIQQDQRDYVNSRETSGLNLKFIHDFLRRPPVQTETEQVGVAGNALGFHLRRSMF